MEEEQVRRIIREELAKNTYLNGAPLVPPHKHDGVSNLKVNEDDLIGGKKFMFFGTATNGPFTFNSISGPSRLTFYGFAANNASGPATQRAIINGTAEFGDCVNATSVEPTVFQPQNNLQVCNSMYINETGPAFRVTAITDFFAYAYDGSSVLASARVTDVTRTSITVEVFLASGWTLSGGYIVT